MSPFAFKIHLIDPCDNPTRVRGRCTPGSLTAPCLLSVFICLTLSRAISLYLARTRAYTKKDSLPPGWVFAATHVRVPAHVCTGAQSGKDGAETLARERRPGRRWLRSWTRSLNLRVHTHSLFLCLCRACLSRFNTVALCLAFAWSLRASSSSLTPASSRTSIKHVLAGRLLGKVSKHPLNNHSRISPHHSK